MDLYIYSDESGVFDKAHNEIFVYGGLIFLGKRMIATEISYSGKGRTLWKVFADRRIKGLQNKQ